MSREQYVRICECGCGQPTLIAIEPRPTAGWLKGQPLRRRHGHSGFGRDDAEYAVDEVTGCWMWQWSLDRKGYGERRHNGRTQRAHRVVYEREVGPIPDGLVLDHLCRTPACVNPEHLEPVTNAENLRRHWAHVRGEAS